MKIYIAADHAGFELKEALKPFLNDLGYEVEDCGAHEMNADDDYPEIIANAVRKLSGDIAAGLDARAIVIGKSGQGEAMVANRFGGVRAAVYYGKRPEILILSREHNDANTLSLGAEFLTREDAEEAVTLWLTRAFSGDERHSKRNKNIDEQR